MTGTEDDAHALRRDFAAAGLDPAGIDLVRLAAMKQEAEAKIASYRDAEGFASADPAFNPPAPAPAPAKE